MPSDNSMTSAEGRLLEGRMEHLRSDVGRIAELTHEVQRKLDPLPALVVTIESIRADIARSGVSVSDHEKRLQAIERDLPGLRELRRWVIGGIIACVGLVGVAMIRTVLLDQTVIRAVQQQQKAIQSTPAPKVQNETEAGTRSTGP